MIDPLHSPGISADEIEPLKQSILALTNDGPDIVIEYNPAALDIGILGIEHDETNGLKTTTATWIELPRDAWVTTGEPGFCDSPECDCRDVRDEDE